MMTDGEQRGSRRPTTIAPPARGSMATPPPRLVDGAGRVISYLRLSVTDRCNLRCGYCMAERQRFVPRDDVLSVEELDRLASVFVRLGVRHVRITGGEPFARHGVLDLVTRLGRHLGTGDLDELTLTTNGVGLAAAAPALRAAGVRRVNVSLDSLDPAVYRRITRGGDLGAVLGGIEAARAARLAVKLNVVALRDDNAHELPSIIAWAHARGLDVSLIETMPLGDVGERASQYLSLATVRDELAARFTLLPEPRPPSGPARYYRLVETGGTLGFITPLSHGFCHSCNRVRVTCTGVLYLCLGHDERADLRAPLRGAEDDEELARAIRAAVLVKPERHGFVMGDAGTYTARTMSVTGG